MLGHYVAAYEPIVVLSILNVYLRLCTNAPVFIHEPLSLATSSLSAVYQSLVTQEVR